MSSVSMTGGRRRSRAVKLPALPLTLIFLLSPRTPAARPTALCDCRSLYCRSTSPDAASRKYWTTSICGVTRAHAPGQAEASCVQRQHHQLRLIRPGLIGAGQRRHAGARAVSRHCRIRWQIDPVVQVPEDRQDHAVLVELPADVGAVHPDAAVVLIGALDDMAGKSVSFADLADAQLPPVRSIACVRVSQSRSVRAAPGTIVARPGRPWAAGARLHKRASAAVTQASAAP
jgi:hypothetical protein